MRYTVVRWLKLNQTKLGIFLHLKISGSRVQVKLLSTLKSVGEKKKVTWFVVLHFGFALFGPHDGIRLNDNKLHFGPRLMLLIKNKLFDLYFIGVVHR